MDADDTLDEAQGVMMHGAAAVSRAAEVLLRHGQDQKMRQSLQTAQVTEDLQRRAEAQAQAAERFFTKAADPEWIKTAGADDVAAAWKGAQRWREIDPDRFDQHAQTITGHVQAEYGVPPTAAGADLDAAAWRCVERINEQRDATHGGREADEDLANREHRIADREHQAERQDQAVSRDEESGVSTGQDAVAQHDAALDAEQAADRHTSASAAAGYAEADYDTPERRQATDAAMRDAGVPDQARHAWAVADQLNGQHPRAAVTKPGKTTSQKPHRSRGRRHEPERSL